MTVEIAGDSIDPVEPQMPPPEPVAELEARPARRPVGRPPNKAAEPSAGSTAAKRMSEETDQGIADWLQGMVGDGEVRVAITRRRPIVGPNGENVSGHLETIEEKIDEDYIREAWGGGTFSLSILTLRPNGQWKILTSRTIKLAGPPKMNGRLLGGEGGAIAPVAVEDNSLAERAFVTMERTAREERQRADKIEERQARGNGFDFAAMQALQAPLIEQLRSSQETIARLQSDMIALSNKPQPRDDFRDRLMERAIDGESSRVEKLKEQYEARIDKLRDNFDDERRRIEDHHREEIKRIESRHERELTLAAKTIDGQMKNTDVAFAARIDALKETVSRLERELTAAGTKVATLEAKKDQSPADKADELVKLREALDVLGGGDDKDEAWYEKVIGAIGNSEAAIGLLNKITGGPGGGAPQQQVVQQQPQQQLPPPGVPFQTGDGNVYVRDAQGNTQILDQAALARQRKVAAARARKKAAANGQPAAEGAGDDGDEEDDGDDAPPVKPPDAKDIKIAITFMESAVRANATPESFAQSARSLVSGDVLEWIGQVGVDKVLNQFAKLEQNSPLRTIRGRQFARAVSQILLQGERDPEPAPETPPEA